MVAACGPESLINVTRNNRAKCVRAGGPLVELHVGQFGWWQDYFWKWSLIDIS